jgi:hypothetical protein
LKKRYILLGGLGLSVVLLFAVPFTIGYMTPTREEREASMSADDVAAGKGCLDSDGNLPALVDYAKAQLADQTGFRPVSTSLLSGAKVSQDIANGQSLVSMHFAGKNQMGGMSFFDAIAMMKPSDCSLGFVDVKPA